MWSLLKVVYVFNGEKMKKVKFYKKYLFRNNIGGITFVSGICDDFCMFV